MTKRENHLRDLAGLFDGFFETGDAEHLLRYLVANSNLPGRRANLELAQAFGDLVEAYATRESQRMWTLCVRMADNPSNDAPANMPLAFIPFCGTLGIGAVGSVSPVYRQSALVSLRHLANDPRRRMREAVRFGLQRPLATHRQATCQALRAWIVAGAWLEMRAAATAVAEPCLLQDRAFAISALQLQRKVMHKVLASDDRRSEPFRVLRKALGYTLSVVVCAIPEEGFAFLAELLESQDPDVLWIIKQNLKKKRLTKAFPDQVQTIRHRFPD